MKLFYFFVFALVISSCQSTQERYINSSKLQKLVNNCNSCHDHGIKTQSPPLNGMEAWYLKEQLAKYKSGIRGSVQDSLASQKMHLATQNLNDEDIKFLAHLYAEKESQKSQPLITGDFNYGKNLYQKNCYACHEGAMGKFFTGSPSLNTLPDWYIVNQFNNFYQKKRGTHPKDPKGLRMAARVNTIKIDDIKHIAHYLHSRQ